MKYSLIIFSISLIFASCEKELSLEQAQPVQPLPPTEPPPPVKETRKYYLSAFYSDIPIDFVENDDEVRSETNLWAYVYEYLKDDVYEFTIDSVELQVHQNNNKIAGNSDPVLHQKYFIGNDTEGPYMRFLGPEYEVLRYQLQEMTDDHFIIYLKWKHNSIIYSRYDRVY